MCLLIAADGAEKRGGAPHWGLDQRRTAWGLRPTALAERDEPRFQERYLLTCTSTGTPEVERGGYQKIILPQF